LLGRGVFLVCVWISGGNGGAGCGGGGGGVVGDWGCGRGRSVMLGVRGGGL